MFYAFSSLVCITATVGGLYLGVARMQTPAGNDIYKSACVLQLGADDDPDSPLLSSHRPPHGSRSTSATQ